MVITVEEVTTSGACAGDYVITRTFTATDDCGNATSATQTSLSSTLQHRSLLSQLITRQNALTSTQMDGSLPSTDNCGEVVITVEEVTTAGACAGDT